MYSLTIRLSRHAYTRLHRLGLWNSPTWEQVVAQPTVRLYAGFLSPDRPQWPDHWGLTSFVKFRRNLDQDLLDPIPAPDNTVDSIQAEDVLEHLPYDRVLGVLEEFYRVLKPGGFLRISIPDYRFDGYRERCLTGADGELLFDPGGGGAYVDGQVVDGGHLWFPVSENVEALYAASGFAKGGRYELVHHVKPDGTPVLTPIDYSRGYIQRTPDHDPRAMNPRRPMSIVADAWKS